MVFYYLQTLMGRKIGNYDIGLEAAAISACNHLIINRDNAFPIADVKAIGKGVCKGVATSLQPPHTLLVWLKDMLFFKLRFRVEPQKGKAFVDIGPVPWKVHEAERAEDFFQSFAGCKAAH